MLLNATNPNSTYRWQDNSTSATYNITSAGNYSVTVTNTSGCKASDSIEAGYTTPPLIINLGNDTTYCGNFSRVLISGYVSTHWSTGVIAPQITVTTPGTFLRATAHSSCGTGSDTITLGDITPPAVTTLVTIPPYARVKPFY